MVKKQIRGEEFKEQTCNKSNYILPSAGHNMNLNYLLALIQYTKPSVTWQKSK